MTHSDVLQKAAVPLRKMAAEAPRLPFEVHPMQWIEAHRPENLATMHRHDYYVIIWVKNGQGTHFIDYQSYGVRPNAVFFLSPGQVHWLQAGPNPEGWVVSFLPDFFHVDDPHRQLLFDTGLFHQFRSDCGRFALPTERSVRVEGLFQALEAESLQEAPFKAEAVRSSLELLLIEFSRAFLTLELLQSYQSKAGELTRSFLLAVEHQFKDQKKVADYAARLGVTANHLNETVKRVTGFPASEHIRKRTVLEAKRLAGFTALSMKEVGFRLGFDDMPHFSKYFKQATGISFSEFREQALSAI